MASAAVAALVALRKLRREIIRSALAVAGFFMLNVLAGYELGVKTILQEFVNGICNWKNHMMPQLTGYALQSHL